MQVPQFRGGVRGPTLWGLSCSRGHSFPDITMLSPGCKTEVQPWPAWLGGWGVVPGPGGCWSDSRVGHILG